MADRSRRQQAISATRLKYFQGFYLAAYLFSFLSTNPALADDTIEMRTTTIKGNTELPKILYVVPWQDANETKSSQQKLVLHSLFGDLFEPVTPPTPKSSQPKK